MTPEEAIDFLDGILAKAAVNKETHNKIIEALTVLRNLAVKPQLMDDAAETN